MITGESRPVREDDRGPGGGWHGGDRLRAARPCRRGRRRHRAWPGSAGWSRRRRHRDPERRRWPTAPPPLLFYFATARWRSSPSSVWFVRWRSDAGGGAHGDRAGDRLPARPRTARSRWSSRCRPALAAQAGILIKDRLALERMRTVDARAVRQDRHAHQGPASRRRISPPSTASADGTTALLALAGGG